MTKIADIQRGYLGSSEYWTKEPLGGSFRPPLGRIQSASELAIERYLAIMYAEKPCICTPSCKATMSAQRLHRRLEHTGGGFLAMIRALELRETEIGHSNKNVP